MLAIRSKLISSGLYSAPAGGGTVAGVIALKLGIDPALVLLGSTLLAQGLHALAARLQRKRKAKAKACA
jgi:hypothetical protein